MRKIIKIIPVHIYFSSKASVEEENAIDMWFPSNGFDVENFYMINKTHLVYNHNFFHHQLDKWFEFRPFED